MWIVNNGAFKAGEMTVVNNLQCLQFTSKRKINSHFYINPNTSQKYKIIFGLDLLIENKFDFIPSTEMIDWQGIQV